jgi:hypothetical protein
VRKFKADPACTLGMNATVGDLYACPLQQSLEVPAEISIQSLGK